MNILPSNTAVGATMANQEEYDRDRLKLVEVKLFADVQFTFGSFEPLLGPVILDKNAPDWIIVGGESGPHARPMHPEWARSLRDQCAAAGVPFLFKQWGEWGPDTGPNSSGPDKVMLGKTPVACLSQSSEWQHYPSGFSAPVTGSVGAWVYRHGKRTAGRLLDGIEHNGFPGVAA